MSKMAISKLSNTQKLYELRWYTGGKVRDLVKTHFLPCNDDPESKVAYVLKRLREHYAPLINLTKDLQGSL